MTYKLEQIEGIGPHFAERLLAAGVHNTDELLERCATDEGMRKLASNAAVSVMQLTAWNHQADLMRVSGIGSEFGQLLEVSGVESVKQLAQREPENVVNLLHRVNSDRKLTRAVPSIKTVSKWITRAKELVPSWRERDRTGAREAVGAGVQGTPGIPGSPGMPHSAGVRNATGNLGVSGTGSVARTPVATNTSGTPSFGGRPW